MPESLVDRRVEDRRPKRIGDWHRHADLDDPTLDRYSGIFGTVVSQSPTGFQVQWDDGHRMGYSFEFLVPGGIEVQP